MLEYIFNNIDWIFSGAGVTALVLLGTYFIKRYNSKNVIQTDGILGVVETINESLISLYSIIPNFILRWRFKEARVNSLLTIDVRPRGESIRLNLGELPECQVWVQLVNHSPFDLDIENIKGELNYNGCRVNIETKEHINVSRHSSNDNIFLEGALTGEQANHCSKNNKESFTSLSLRIRIRTKFGIFKKHSGDLQSLHVRVINKREI